MKIAVVASLYLVSFIAAAQTPLSIVSPPLSGSGSVDLAAAVNTPLNVTFSATGGTPPYTWSARDCPFFTCSLSLPPGLQLSTDGVLTGSPFFSGSAQGYWIFVEDAAGASVFAQLNLTVTPELILTNNPFLSSIVTNAPVQIGSIDSSPSGIVVTVHAIDPWVKFEVGLDTTCSQTASSITVVTGTSPVALEACLSNPPNQNAAYALVTATAAGFQPVADGLTIPVNGPALFYGSPVNLTSSAAGLTLSTLVGQFNGPPTITYSSATTDWLSEFDNCSGSSNCTLGLAPNPLSSLSVPGEQVAARLDFSSSTGLTGSQVAVYRYLPTTVAITSPNAFGGSYDWEFAQTVSASGGVAPYTWSAAALPSGLSISSAGVISGLVPQPGTWHSFLTASDFLGRSTSQAVTFTFEQGAPALALTPQPPPGQPPNPFGSNPFNVGQISSSPPNALVTLTLGTSDALIYGFPDANTASGSCASPTASITLATPTPQSVFLCLVDSSGLQADSAGMFYVSITASAQGFAPVTALLPLGFGGVNAMSLATPLDISATGSATLAVTVVSSNGNVTDTLAGVQVQDPWLNVAPVDPNNCLQKITCSFNVTANAATLNPVVGQTYVGSAIFSTNQGLSAGLKVMYKYSGTPLAIASTSFNAVAGLPFTATAMSSGGTGPYVWSSADLPAGLSLTTGGTIAGSLAAPGAAQAHLSVTDGTNHMATATVTFNAISPGQAGLQFVPVPPCRVADTRLANGPLGGPIVGANTTRDFPVPGGPCGIPSTALAYSLNITVVPRVHLSYTTAWPTGQGMPTASVLNSYDGRIKANAAILPAGDQGAISIFATDDTQIILDVNGYFVPAASNLGLAFYPLTPCRVVDTRAGTGPLAGPSFSKMESRDLPVQASSCNIPPTAQAYSLNFTVVPKKTLGYLSTWPTGQALPQVSTLNDGTGTTLANAAIVPAGTAGDISVFTTDATDLILDINGYFAPPGAGGLSLYNLPPCRALDTRTASGAFNGLLPVAMNGGACVIPASAQAFVLNATAVPPKPLGYITLWPDGQPQPLASTLNSYDGSVTSNMAIVPGAAGSIDAFSSSATQLILDCSGYFAP